MVGEEDSAFRGANSQFLSLSLSGLSAASSEGCALAFCGSVEDSGEIRDFQSKRFDPEDTFSALALTTNQ